MSKKDKNIINEIKTLKNIKIDIDNIENLDDKIANTNKKERFNGSVEGFIPREKRRGN